MQLRGLVCDMQPRDPTRHTRLYKLPPRRCFPFRLFLFPRSVTEAEPFLLPPRFTGEPRCYSTSNRFRLATTVPNPCASSWLGFGAKH
jgi:hypothetical protein